eukprot:gnl/TRDRNA2_/TRDRNA2_76789_c0_seq1.p1 gnl/TRDRNA2_/TRDRNA2_76789_c0~~gnl/TRDRNA2_/TRDRNA2_76789_c0_seq1.p1  ORF type:complete len:103 (+),score=4.18 gnl/TRDRNA2_/TRDRNA2_76789_c0_seq1:108-416(+)
MCTSPAGHSPTLFTATFSSTRKNGILSDKLTVANAQTVLATFCVSNSLTCRCAAVANMLNNGTSEWLAAANTQLMFVRFCALKSSMCLCDIFATAIRSNASA